MAQLEHRPPADSPPSLWQNRDYMVWWAGTGLSTLGSSVSSIAFPLYALYATGSAVQAGSISAANLIGSVTMTLVGGVLTDRVSRRAIMICGPLAQTVALALVAWLVQRGGGAPLLPLVACALLSGLASGLTMGAATPALRRIVPREQVGAATAQGMGRDLVAQLIGSPLGGLLFATARWLPFLADAVSYVCAALGVALIRRPLGPDRSETGRQGMFGGLAAGVRMVRHHPYLRFTVVWGAFLNAVTQGFLLLLIALVKYRGGGPTAVGTVNAAALVGGVVGAVVTPRVMRRLRAKTVLVVAMWLFVESFAAVAAVPRPWQIGAVLLVAMVATVPLNVVLESYEARLVPDEFSGRVAAVTRFGMQCLQWTGPLVAGCCADLFGVPGAVLALMIAMLALALVLHRSRSLGVLDIPLEDVVELTGPADGEARGAGTASGGTHG